MELKRFQRLREELIPAELDLGNDTVRQLIEHYSRSPELGIDPALLDAVRDRVAELNRLTGQSVALRYYQVLALVFAERALSPRTGETSPRMLAYWMATGSGKTLVMHLNLLQVLQRAGDFERFEIILTTPGVNLIEQHRRELIPLVEALNQRHGGRIELRIETTGALLQKDADFFALPEDGRTHRLVLVDEGHIGLSTREEGAFKKLRQRLNTGNSLLLEYSATYHNLAANLREEYEDAIVFDYNYARFYRDGYGKDHFFKPIGADVRPDEDLDENLRENFRVLQDKLRAHARLEGRFPDRPLLAFMGNTVENPRDEGRDDEVSDVMKVLDFLARLSDAERTRYGRVFGNGITGPLTVTRNRQMEDEILLSYGDGEYWGIVNVGGGDRFFAGIDHPLIRKHVAPILDERILFRNLDAAASPINVLIGSRKFAEGWNSFRVSVIGLVNLGTGRGNKIIQIFGRGVRLRGLRGDGKRKHNGTAAMDYYALGGTLDDDIRRLETLTVFSLKRSYLQTFIEEIRKETRYSKSYSIAVTPSVVRLGTGREVPFEEYRDRLPVWKLAKKTAGPLRVVLDAGEILYQYLDEGVERENRLRGFTVSLDYRVDRDRGGSDIRADLRVLNERLSAFLDAPALGRHIAAESAAAGVQLYGRSDGGALRDPTIKDLLALIGTLRYKEQIGPEVPLIEALNRRVASDVVTKLRNKVVHDINSRNYVFGEPLRQSTPEERGDFIHAYELTRDFDTEQARDEFPEAEAIRYADGLRIRETPQHVYEPLLRESTAREFRISPDMLNPGERKFVRDFCDYVRVQYGGQERYEFYLMRNVESLRSIGVYLESDEGVFYPDFLAWILDRETGRARVLLVDPKGQTGIRSERDFGLNDKVKISLRNEANPALLRLEQALQKAWGVPAEVYSFLLLRKKSTIGTSRVGAERTHEEMLANNVLRLDWHAHDEEQSGSELFAGERSYLDLIFEKIGMLQPAERA